MHLRKAANQQGGGTAGQQPIRRQIPDPFPGEGRCHGIRVARGRGQGGGGGCYGDGGGGCHGDAGMAAMVMSTQSLWRCWGGCHGDAEVVAMVMMKHHYGDAGMVAMVMLGWLPW